MNSRSSTMHSIRYDGKVIEITVTDEKATTNNWLRDIYSKYSGRPMVVGLDIEWRPNRSRSMNNKSATLQLCIDKKCLILQLFYIDAIPNLLRQFLEDPNFTFVGVEVKDDILKLNNDYGLDCAKSCDIRLLAKAKWPERFSRPGLKDLAMEICGLYMPKPKHISLSNWDARILSSAQIEYACIDAYASYKIGFNLIMQ